MIHLFVNYYNDKDEKRQQEINECLSRNLANHFIDKIYLVVDSTDIDFCQHGQSRTIETIIQDGRPTYSFLFELANMHMADDDIAIFPNIDIYYEAQDLFLVKNYLRPSICFALSRWEKGSDGRFHLFEREDSQDSWIFKGPIKVIPNCDFTMGKPGCDNAISQRIEAAGYSVHNPSCDIKSYHLHDTGIRNYDRLDNSQIVEKPYKNIPPCSLENFQVINWVTEIANLPDERQYSQYGEDAIIGHIFKNIGTTNKYFVDLGAGAYGESTMSNTRMLLQSGWNGYGVDANNKGEDWIIERFITPGNILGILEEQHTPKNFDFLNLDIDSCDFWVLMKVLEEYSPRCICTEYNGTLNPEISVVLKYEEGYTWDLTSKYGYSFNAGKKLLAEFGYRIIYNHVNQNLFALQEELIKGLIFNVTATEVHYHPENPNVDWETY